MKSIKNNRDGKLAAAERRNAQADARLIAAAPEMLAVLIRTLPCMVEVERRAGTNGKLSDDIRAAIARATGGAL